MNRFKKVIRKGMNWIRLSLANIIIFAFSSILAVLAAEFTFRIFYEKLRNYPTHEQLVQYVEMGPRNHHKRDIDVELLKAGKQYYSVYRRQEYNDVERFTVIFQGDSWALLLDKVDRFSDLMLDRADIFINGGTASYSPSLMEIQLQDIISQQNIKPSLIISYIDQTDFMDEVCVYSKKRLEHNGHLVAVLKPSGMVYERSSPDFMRAKFATGKSKLLFFIENTLHNNSKIQAARQSELYCGWEDISSFMKASPSEQEKMIFLKSLKTYLNYAIQLSDRIILVTHKHRKHYEGIYVSDIYTILVDAVKQLEMTEKVTVVDISPKQVANLDEIFPSAEIDPASHPFIFYYEKNIANRILELVDSSN